MYKKIDPLMFIRPGAIGRVSAAFGGGANEVPIHMDNVQCSGNESRLVDCTHTTYHNCFHVEDAGVVCLPPRKTITIDYTGVFKYLNLVVTDNKRSYRIFSIRRHGYYLFCCVTAWGSYLKASAIQRVATIAMMLALLEYTRMARGKLFHDVMLICM